MQLDGIEGHTVRFADGRRLGQVAWIEYGSRSDQPDALIVRRRFYTRPRRVRIPTQMIASVEREAQTVHLDVGYNRNHFFLRQPPERLSHPSHARHMVAPLLVRDGSDHQQPGTITRTGDCVSPPPPVQRPPIALSTPRVAPCSPL